MIELKGIVAPSFGTLADIAFRLGYFTGFVLDLLFFVYVGHAMRLGNMPLEGYQQQKLTFAHGLGVITWPPKHVIKAIAWACMTVCLQIIDSLGRTLQDLCLAFVDIWKAWCTISWSDVVRLWNPIV